MPRFKHKHKPKSKLTIEARNLDVAERAFETIKHKITTHPKNAQEKSDEFAKFVKERIHTKQGILFRDLAAIDIDGMTQDDKIQAIRYKKLIDYAIDQGQYYGALTLLKYKSKLEKPREFSADDFIKSINELLEHQPYEIMVSAGITAHYPALNLESAMQCWLLYDHCIAKNASEEFIIDPLKTEVMYTTCTYDASVLMQEAGYFSPLDDILEVSDDDVSSNGSPSGDVLEFFGVSDDE